MVNRFNGLHLNTIRETCKTYTIRKTRKPYQTRR
jgi:hypothetical protein